jgi:uncharacterized membrane protein
MRLTKRGERVFATLLLSAFVIVTGAIMWGAVWLATHERVTDQSSCKQTIEGVMCDFTWEAK